MKKIFQRFINLISIFSVVIALMLMENKGFKDGMTALLVGLVIVLMINYVCLGVITVWHKFEKEETNE